jgi:hypothetical protein
MGEPSQAAAALAPAVSPVVAYHHGGHEYGDRGYVWVARYFDNAIIWVVSNMCNPRELGAWDRVENSTAGTTQFQDRWPSGLRWYRHGCDGVVDYLTDIKISYSDWDSTHNGADHWGEHHPVKASPEWCDLWSAPYPCGMHTNKVHINLDQWTNHDDDHEWQERLLMHETGHAMALGEHCIGNPGDSIMNNGLNNCGWTVLVYKPTDRDGFRSIYPEWQYP